MRAHLIQFDIAWEDKAANFKTVRSLISGAGVKKNDLILLPEMFDTGFSLNTDITADSDDVTLQSVRALAHDFEVYVQGGRTVIAKQGDMATNRAVMARPDGTIVGEYAKIHPFTYGREPERFVGGDRVMTYPWGDLTVCPAICYDLRFPELFRDGLAAGAQLFALGANWPAARNAHWRALSIARAIENQAFMLAVNRTGSDPHLSYLGSSIAVSPAGEILGELADEVGVLTVEIDPADVLAWRSQFPAWRDARLHPGLRTLRAPSDTRT